MNFFPPSGNVRAEEPVCAVGGSSAGDATGMLTVCAAHFFRLEHPEAEGTAVPERGWANFGTSGATMGSKI